MKQNLQLRANNWTTFFFQSFSIDWHQVMFLKYLTMNINMKIKYFGLSSYQEKHKMKQQTR